MRASAANQYISLFTRIKVLIRLLYHKSSLSLRCVRVTGRDPCSRPCPYPCVNPSPSRILLPAPPVLPGAGQGWPDPLPRVGAAHRPLPVGGGAGLRGGGGDGQVQGRPAQVLQEPGRALHLLREELPQPAPPATGRQPGGGAGAKGLGVDHGRGLSSGVLVLLHARRNKYDEQLSSVYY